MRRAYWGPAGLLLVLVVYAVFQTMAWVRPIVVGRIGNSILLALAVGAAVGLPLAYFQAVVIRTAILQRLRRRLSPTP